MHRNALRISGRHPLSYCTNVHPAATLDDAERVLRDTVAPSLHKALGDGALLLGAWWPADVAFALASDETKLRSHGQLLAELRLVPASLNIFPQGRFHGPGVKESVYLPDWRSEERLSYTVAAARAQASLLAMAGCRQGALSTLPLGFRGRDRESSPEAEHVHAVFRAATALSRIAEETEVELVLSIEPEPWCLLETIRETIAWIEDELRPYAAAQGCEESVRRHVGLCLDLCHAAVVGEDPVAAVRQCEQAQVRIGKVQLSSALHAVGPSGFRALLEYDEASYLHQLFERGGARRFVDLGVPEARGHEAADDEEWRAHFHVPLHWAGEAPLNSTKPEVLRFLELVRSGGLPEGTPMEVETYTNPAIGEELDFVVSELTR